MASPGPVHFGPSESELGQLVPATLFLLPSTSSVSGSRISCLVPTPYSRLICHGPCLVCSLFSSSSSAPSLSFCCFLSLPSNRRGLLDGGLAWPGRGLSPAGQLLLQDHCLHNLSGPCLTALKPPAFPTWFSVHWHIWKITVPAGAVPGALALFPVFCRVNCTPGLSLEWLCASHCSLPASYEVPQELLIWMGDNQQHVGLRKRKGC